MDKEKTEIMNLSDIEDEEESLIAEKNN